MCVFAAPNYADMENCSECSKDARPNKCNKCTKCSAAFHKDCNKSNIIIDAAKSTVLCKKCVYKITNERDSYRSELTQDKLKIDSLNEELTDLRNENIELKNIIAKITSMQNDLKWLKEQVTSNSNRLDQIPSFEQPSSSPTNPNPHPSNTNLEQKIFDSFYEITDREKRKFNLVVRGWQREMMMQKRSLNCLNVNSLQMLTPLICCASELGEWVDTLGLYWSAYLT